MSEALIEIRDLCKIYNPGEVEVRALDHVSLTINRGRTSRDLSDSRVPANPR